MKISYPVASLLTFCTLVHSQTTPTWAATEIAPTCKQIGTTLASSIVPFSTSAINAFSASADASSACGFLLQGSNLPGPDAVTQYQGAFYDYKITRSLDSPDEVPSSGYCISIFSTIIEICMSQVRDAFRNGFWWNGLTNFSVALRDPSQSSSRSSRSDYTDVTLSYLTRKGSSQSQSTATFPSGMQTPASGRSVGSLWSTTVNPRLRSTDGLSTSLSTKKIVTFATDTSSKTSSSPITSVVLATQGSSIAQTIPVGPSTSIITGAGFSTANVGNTPPSFSIGCQTSPQITDLASSNSGQGGGIGSCIVSRRSEQSDTPKSTITIPTKDSITKAVSQLYPSTSSSGTTSQGWTNRPQQSMTAPNTLSITPPPTLVIPTVPFASGEPAATSIGFAFAGLLIALSEENSPTILPAILHDNQRRANLLDRLDDLEQMAIQLYKDKGGKGDASNPSCHNTGGLLHFIEHLACEIVHLAVAKAKIKIPDPDVSAVEAELSEIETEAEKMQKDEQNEEEEDEEEDETKTGDKNSKTQDFEATSTKDGKTTMNTEDSGTTISLSTASFTRPSTKLSTAVPTSSFTLAISGTISKAITRPSTKISTTLPTKSPTTLSSGKAFTTLSAKPSKSTSTASLTTASSSTTSQVSKVTFTSLSTKTSSARLTSVSTTISSSSMMTRYLILPSFDAPASQIAAISTRVENLRDVTVQTGTNGSPLFWAATLTDEQSKAFGNDAALIAETPTQPGEESAEGLNITKPEDIAKRGLWDDQPHVTPQLSKRALWLGRKAGWYDAIISDYPGLVPNPKGYSGAPYRLGGEPYRYIWDNTVKPGAGVRVYVIDAGLNMLHPEFASRARRGNLGGPADFGFSWIFGEVDRSEKVWNLGSRTWENIETNWQDPDAAPSGANGNLPDAYSDWNGHGTAMISLIVGDTIGNAPGADLTVVKIPKYTSGDFDGQYVRFSIMSALYRIIDNVLAQHAQGVLGKTIISVSLNTFFRGETNSESEEAVFEKVWQNALEKFRLLGVLVVTSSGNNFFEPGRGVIIDSLPARIMRPPMFVVGNVATNAMRADRSQGEEGDGILTVSAAGQYVKIAYYQPDETYADAPDEKIGPYTFDSGTSISCVKVVALAAYFLGSFNGLNPLPNDYAYDKIMGLAYARVTGGPKIIYNGAPASAHQGCIVAGKRRKRDDGEGDDSCQLSLTTLATEVATHSRGSLTSSAANPAISMMPDNPTTTEPPPPTTTTEAPPPPPPPQHTYGVFLGYQEYTGGSAYAETKYYFKVWASKDTDATPDYCKDNSWVSSVEEEAENDDGLPYPGYPVSFHEPDTDEDCKWHADGEPGHIECGQLGRTVTCEVASSTKAIKCDLTDYIVPVAQCYWTAP